MKQFSKILSYCKRIIAKYFNKNLVISKSAKKCNKSYKQNDIRVRDHDHIAEKYRGSVHRICDFNFKLTKNVLVVFHNFRGHDSHLIMQVIGKFNINISVIPNGLEKYIALTINKNMFFSWQHAAYEF